MLHNPKALALLAECQDSLNLGNFRAALLSARSLVDEFSGDNLELLLQGMLCMSLACQGNGQMFFAEQYKRFIKTLTDANCHSRIEIPDATQPAGSNIDHEVACCICKGWHHLGIPVIPSLDLLTYLCTDLDGSKGVRAIYCNLPLPVLLDGIGHPMVLVACHDLTLSQEAIEYFHHAVGSSVLLGDIDYVPITANASDRIGVIARLPKNEISSVVAAGKQVKECGLRLSDIPFATGLESPSDLATWGDKMTLLEAHLFALPIYSAASQGYAAEGAPEAFLDMEIRRAGSLASLGNEEEAERILLQCKEDAENYCIDSITGLVDQILERVRGKDIDSSGPFVFDPSTGKVIGGVLPEDAEHELHASKVLAEAWKKEYPEIEAPLTTILAVTHFEYDVPIKGTGQIRHMKLAQIMRAFKGIHRLDRVDIREFAGKDPELYLSHFGKTFFRLLFVVHKKLNGTLSSPTGSALSMGNVTPEPTICDYETVLLPSLGDAPRTKEQTVVDLTIAVEMIIDLASRLGIEGKLVETLLDCFGVDEELKICRKEIEGTLENANCEPGDSAGAHRLAEYLFANGYH